MEELSDREKPEEKSTIRLGTHDLLNKKPTLYTTELHLKIGKDCDDFKQVPVKPKQHVYLSPTFFVIVFFYREQVFF